MIRTNMAQYVLPAPLHPPFPAIPQIQSRELAIACKRLASKAVHTGCGYDLEAASTLQAITWSATDMQYLCLYCSFGMYNTLAESAREKRQARHYPRCQASRRDSRRLALRATHSRYSQRACQTLEGRSPRGSCHRAGPHRIQVRPMERHKYSKSYQSWTCPNHRRAKPNASGFAKSTAV
jgi:hypothetical protein